MGGSTGASLGQVMDVLVVVQRLVPGMVQRMLFREGAAVRRQGLPCPCRGAEANLHGLLDNAENCGVSAVAVHRLGLRSPCRGAEAHPMDFLTMQKTVVYPQLHFIDQLLRRPCSQIQRHV